MLRFTIPVLAALAVLFVLNIHNGAEATLKKRVARMHYSNVFPYEAVPDPWDQGGGFPYPGPYPGPYPQPPYYQPLAPAPAPPPPPPPNVVYIPGPQIFHKPPEPEVIYGDPVVIYEPAGPPIHTYEPALPPQVTYI